jgi:hypothetical protein
MAFVLTDRQGNIIEEGRDNGKTIPFLSKKDAKNFAPSEKKYLIKPYDKKLHG